MQNTMKQRRFRQVILSVNLPLLYNVLFVNPANITRGDVSLRATQSQVTQLTTPSSVTPRTTSSHVCCALNPTCVPRGRKATAEN